MQHHDELRHWVQCDADFMGIQVLEAKPRTRHPLVGLIRESHTGLRSVDEVVGRGYGCLAIHRLLLRQVIAQSEDPSEAI